MELPRLDGVAHRTVMARGLRFHVAEAGAGDPLVLVHGWPQHWWMWRHVVPLLAPHARLVMIDLRGFGWSDAPPGGYDKQTLADGLRNKTLKEGTEVWFRHGTGGEAMTISELRMFNPGLPGKDR